MKILRIFALLALLALPSVASAQKTTRFNPTLAELLDMQLDNFLLPAVNIPVFQLPPVPGAPGTSGTLATQTTQNWSTAPWVITEGAGTYPDGGGIATWATAINNIIGTVAANVTVTLDVPVTLSGITYNSPWSMTLAGSATNNLTLASTGAIFDTQLSIANTLSLFNLANNITAPITGGGSAGLTKTGNGTLTLGVTVTGGNSYTGGTHLNGGITVISATAAIGDSVFGATGAGNGISFNGGGLLNNITGGWTTGRDIFVDAGGATIYPNTAATLNGIISGSGNLRLSGFSGAVTMTGANTFSGSMITDSVSTLTISGANGTLNAASSYDLAGVVNLGSTVVGANNNDRLSDTAPITSRGATINLLGNTGASTTENAGALTLASGSTLLSATSATGQQSTLNFSSITRNNNATMVVRGNNLGAAAASGVSQITSAASPGTLIGGGGAAGSTNISILPWAIGNTAIALTNSSFVTWDSGTGAFRPLATTEYTTLASGLTTTDNTRVTAATAISAPTTVNSVVLAGTGALSGTGGLNITSGAFLFSTGTASGAGTVSANLNFGGAEGIITNANSGALTVSGVISGSNGLTLTSPGTGAIALTGANTYTGTTTLNGNSQVNYSGTVSNDGVTPSAFGLGTNAIVANPGTGTLTLWATAASTFNRDISITGNGPGLVDLGTSGTTYSVTVNGNVNINGANTRLALDSGTTSTAAMIMNGVISGTGQLTDSNSSFNFLNGNNTYSGGTNIQTGTYAAGSNTAFGTGTIYFSNTGKIQSADATAHTLANNILLGANPTFQGTGALTFTGDVNLNSSRSFAVSNSAAAGVSFTGTVSNGALTKTGTGTLGLNHSSGNTYTGGTVLGTSAGILNVNNTSGSGTGSGTVSIGGTTTANRSTLSGSFNIAGATQISGVLSPGNGATLNGIGDIGTAAFGSNLTFTANTVTNMELASSSSFDRITVAGAFTVLGTINVTTIGGFVAQAGMSFDLVDWGTIVPGSFNPATNINFSGAMTAPGTMFDTSNFLTDGTISVVAVPEPSTWAMVFSGVGMLGTVMRLRRRSR